MIKTPKKAGNQSEIMPDMNLAEQIKALSVDFIVMRKFWLFD